MRSLILGLCVVSNTVFANFNAGEMMSSMMPLATTMLQNQQQAKQAEAQTDQARAQLVGQENAMVQQQAQLQQAETNNLMSQENKGYPILDPFARQSYWALRDTQFKQSMAIAAQRSQLETKASKDAIDKEFQATQQMMTAVGGLMKTAGAQVQKIGEASEKKKAESQASAQATSDANDKSIHCQSDNTNCHRTAQPNGQTCPSGFTLDAGANLCKKPLSAAETQARNAAIQQQQQQQLAAPPQGCDRVTGQLHQVSCGGTVYADAGVARQAQAIDLEIVRLTGLKNTEESQYNSECGANNSSSVCAARYSAIRDYTNQISAEQRKLNSLNGVVSRPEGSPVVAPAVTTTVPPDANPTDQDNTGTLVTAPTISI